MSTNAPEFEFDLEAVAAALLASKGVKSGLWRLAAKLRFAGLTARVGPDEKDSGDMPVGLVGFDGLALFAASKPGQLVFDAAKLASKSKVRSRAPSPAAAPAATKATAKKAPARPRRSSTPSKQRAD